ncbi:MAG: cytochrome c oxidase subunit 3 [Myxococcales bacterium]|nr:cytochrome c oxidase subunit 3 [Myxococcales bacterium]MCB9649881.1 cytochrome c oxidase subunit 3 [Deltaproteobacteria bacterium]
MLSSALRTLPARRGAFDPPGGALMWIIVALELTTFALAFVVLGRLRVDSAELFAAGQAHLEPRFGLLLTVVLLLSGWLVAEGVHAYRHEKLVRVRRLYLAGVALGAIFLGLKAYDYAAMARAGVGLGDDFGAAYFLATGFHALHVLGGLGMLLWVALRVGRKPFEDAETAVAGTALFWHMCDLAWLFLFPLFYVR